MFALTQHRRNVIESRAEALLTRSQFSLRRIARLRRVCQDEGIELFDAGLRDIAGVLRREGSRWRIYLNREDALHRRRCTLARLLGHYCLHTVNGDMFVLGGLCTGYPRPTRVEAGEAQLFAAALLMPGGVVMRQVPHGQPAAPQVRALAWRCGVSPLAMALRLRSLGYDVPSPEYSGEAVGPAARGHRCDCSGDGRAGMVCGPCPPPRSSARRRR